MQLRAPDRIVPIGPLKSWPQIRLGLCIVVQLTMRGSERLEDGNRIHARPRRTAPVRHDHVDLQPEVRLRDRTSAIVVQCPKEAIAFGFTVGVNVGGEPVGTPDACGIVQVVRDLCGIGVPTGSTSGPAAGPGPLPRHFAAMATLRLQAMPPDPRLGRVRGYPACAGRDEATLPAIAARSGPGRLRRPLFKAHCR